MTDLFAPSPTYPESVLLSIYKAYPRPTGRKAALKRIAEALDRICQGEIDGSPRTQAEAIEFLRVKTAEARRLMGAREQKFIPHMATWLFQRRYLRPELAAVIERPKNMHDCICILSDYPTSPDAMTIASNEDIWLPALAAINKALARHSAAHILRRTQLYAMAVNQWPVEDLKFVPNPVKFYSEAQYDRPEASWTRQPNRGFSDEREQLRRILQ